MGNKIDDLEEELNALKKKVNSNNLIDRAIKILATVGTIITILIGVFNYSDTKRSEFRKGFWEKRFELYSEVTNLASKIAIAENLEVVKKEREEFWTLYWGKVSMIEDQAVFDAMVAYGNELFNRENNGAESADLKQLSYLLARSCRESLKKTWEPVLLDNINERTSHNSEKE